MNQPTPKQEAERYAAWRRMRAETQAIIGGSKDPTLSHDLPHVSEFLASMARYRAELALHGSTATGRRAAYEIRMHAEARYVEALLAD